MSGTMQGAMNVADTADRNAFEEEAIEIASQWAQEKVENFLNDIESNGNDHKLLKISHIISRRTSIDVFTGESSDIGKFAKDLIGKLADSKVMEGLENLVGSLLNKLFGSASGSAQTEKIYEVAVDELGELNRLDAFFFCYRFASSGINKAIIGTCIVRSAAIMVDDNAYRVVLASSPTLSDAQRASLVAKYQNRGPVSPVYGTSVATSEQFPQRRSTGKILRSVNTEKSVEPKVGDLIRKTGRPTESSD